MLITTDQRTDNEGRENRAINQRKINDTFQFDPIYKCPTYIQQTWQLSSILERKEEEKDKPRV